METIVTKSIPVKELKDYKDYINFLFKNGDGVYNICANEEDVIKSNQWFKNFPLECFVISDTPVKEGDKFLAFSVNRDLNGKIFTYVGPNSDGVDLIDIIDEDDKHHISTIYLLSDARRFERIGTMEDKRMIVDGQSTMTQHLTLQ